MKFGFTIVPWTLSQHGTNFASEIASLVTLRRILQDINPDSLLSFTIKPNIYGALVGAAAGIHHRFAVVTGLGYIFLNHDWRTRLLRRLIKLLCRHTFGGADVVFFYNDDDRNFFLEQHYLTSDRAVVIPGTGVDTVHFSPGSGASRKAGPVFLFAGRLLADKGVREYAAAARVVRAAHKSSCFQLLGSKDNNPSAIEDEELCAWQDDGVISYLGATSDIRPFLDEADVFVLPSYREGLPRAILEALAMGKPVVTTDVPGCRQTMIDGDNGFVVPPKNVEKLAEAMLRFVTDPDLIRRMGKRSRQMAEQYFNIGRVNQMVIDRIRSSMSGY